MHNERAWPQFSIVLLCTLIVMYLQCTLKFMNCFHVKTSLTYWVLPYSNESNIHCCFCIWAKGIRRIEKQSSRPLNVPMVEHWALSIEHWALSIVRGTRFPFPLPTGLYLARDHVHQHLFCGPYRISTKANSLHMTRGHVYLLNFC